MMNVRRMPSAPPNSPASNTTLSRGDDWPDWDASVVVQSSWANTNAAKSTSWESSTSRSRVDRPGLNAVVQGSTSATSSSPRVIAWSSLTCSPDDPRKMRGLFICRLLGEPLDEVERRLGDLLPPVVDRERVASVRDLHNLGHARVALLPLVSGVRNCPRDRVVLLAIDDQQRAAVGVLRVHLRLCPRVEVRVAHLRERDSGAGDVVGVVELFRLLLVKCVRPAVLE